MKNRLILLRVLFCLVSSSILIPACWAVEVAPFVFPSARSGGMGGTHVAMADDFSTLFYNPAGFAGAKDELSVAEISMETVGPVFDIIDAVTEFLGPAGTLDISNLVGERGLTTGFDLGGPMAFGWIGRGLGFGFFNRTYVEAKAAGIQLNATAFEDIFLVGGYAFRLEPASGHTIDFGFAGKGFLRASGELGASVFSIETIIPDDPLGGIPIKMTAGVGVDVGVIYSYDSLFAVAIACRDAYSPALVSDFNSVDELLSGSSGASSEEYGRIDPSLDVGIAFSPRIDIIQRYVSSLVFAADYRDFLDLAALIPRNPVLNVALGTEIVVLDALSLRAGIADALPNAGFGIDLSFMKFDFAMRGKELGLDPGENPAFVMDLSLTFRY
ncbi:MAG TPA: hypothetical protein DIC34_03045 [Treponema sp.]|nr:MAG: hypothetical protein A2001_07730 [Treponema sp. GWC1_61_84]HCM25520.1 hypothetical protein [Treponema sp.]